MQHESPSSISYWKDFTFNISSSGIIPFDLDLPKVLLGTQARASTGVLSPRRYWQHLQRLVIIGGELGREQGLKTKLG